VGKLDIRAKEWEKNPALLRIMAMLEKAFNDVGEKIREDLIKGYREYADRYFKRFMETSKREQGDIIPRGMYGPAVPFQDWHDYIHTPEYDIRTWEQVRELKSRVKITYKRSDERANASYEHARDSFVYKNVDKMQEVLGKRSDLKNGVIKFDWRGNYFKGNIQIYLENAYFQGDVDIKYVVRTIPRVTPYFQYPLVFTDAEVNGKSYARPAEQQLRNLLSGKTDEEHAAEKKAEATAAGYCPMSGQWPPEKTERVGRYRVCPSCKQTLAVSSLGRFMKHKTREAVKKDAATKLTEAGYCPMSRQKVPAEIVAKIGPVDGYKDPKAPCPGCQQQVRLDARREWIRDQFLTPGGYPSKMTVESATYYKHKLSK
jgi:hypothetical protein